VKSQQMMNIF